MFAALHIPSFPLAVLLRDNPEAAAVPTALVGPGSARGTPLLRAVNRAAARQGVAPGLSTTRAMARCAGLEFLPPDPALERRSQNDLRRFAASLSPDFEETAPGAFLLDLLTLPHSRSDPPAWVEQALRKATVLRLPLHLALAPTPDLALLASLSPATSSRLSFTPEPQFEIRDWGLPAREADPEITPLKSEITPLKSKIENLKSKITPPLPPAFREALFSLPLAHLAKLANLTPQPEEPNSNIEHQRSNIEDRTSSNRTSHSSFILQHSDLLTLWGLSTLGDLAALPRQGLAERLGPDAARLHDILHGKHLRLLRLHRPSQHYRTSRDLDHPLDTLEPLLFLLRRGLDTLCSRLAASRRAAAAARLTLTFDDGDLHLRDLRLPEPTRDPLTLLRLLQTHLDTVTAPSPVVAWSLALTPTLPAQAQPRLFDRSLRDPNKFADTLARLDALLGPRRLGTPRPLDTHQPDQFQISDFKSQIPSPPPPTPHHQSRQTATALPLRRYRPPIPVHVASEPRGRHHHPLALLTGPHQGAVTAVHGPFPLSGSWWDPEEAWQRVEWDLQLEDHTLLRLACHPPRNSKDTKKTIPQWTLEGLYG